ncbi:lupus la ribonucleoprotein, putative [Entamoeba invadens IP1]|uniref:Lupus la ribonucleoprotein, putative n=1 Tax=Entamoeba invadens IP1 TaxID=370355 RepID=A0A0A1UFU9_ENTIV|nr:lupus la ribonucleoprotein, putative [Entamoeba invadens IP1]ELP93667.1 lupus la ribonucleoprotein, putative [Entamoeba invadens IP1]|eukprot:XP_004260438.1 lupus la ribonucleoprotein, putative [Entamoeba invadens IP1]
MNAKHKGGMSALLVQIEYYFCDLNIIQDKFLLGVIETQNGFVPIDTLLGFVKVKELTTSAEEIVKAVETSKTLVLSEDKKSIKRVKPIPTEAEVTRDRCL